MNFGFRLAFGLLVGGIGGLFLGGILRIRSLVPHGFENIFTLAAVFFLFQGSDHVISQSGILAAAIATLTAGMLDERDLAGGSELRALVFLSIAGTVGLAGFTARPLASLLHLRLPYRDRVAILGAEGLGLALGKVFRDQELNNVVFLDSDPKRCHQAEQAGFSVIFGDALQERTLIRSQIELVGTVIGLMSNEHLNHLFVDQARELFGVPQSYVALESLEDDKVSEHIRRVDSRVLWEGPHDVERWAVRIRHNDVIIEQLTYLPPEKTESVEDSHSQAPEHGPPSEKNGERFVILAIKSRKSIFPMYTTYTLQKKDVAFVAVYRHEHKEALAQLYTLGWGKSAEESVEEFDPHASSQCLDTQKTTRSP